MTCCEIICTIIQTFGFVILAIMVYSIKAKERAEEEEAERVDSYKFSEWRYKNMEQASMYADVVDANMENRRLRRALWIARANRALEKIALFRLWNASISTMNPEDGARQEFDKWKKNLGKFLKKAEEYK